MHSLVPYPKSLIGAAELRGPKLFQMHSLAPSPKSLIVAVELCGPKLISFLQHEINMGDQNGVK